MIAVSCVAGLLIVLALVLCNAVLIWLTDWLTDWLSCVFCFIGLRLLLYWSVLSCCGLSCTVLGCVVMYSSAFCTVSHTVLYCTVLHLVGCILKSYTPPPPPLKLASPSGVVFSKMATLVYGWTIALNRSSQSVHHWTGQTSAHSTSSRASCYSVRTSDDGRKFTPDEPEPDS